MNCQSPETFHFLGSPNVRGTPYKGRETISVLLKLDNPVVKWVKISTNIGSDAWMPLIGGWRPSTVNPLGLPPLDRDLWGSGEYQ